MQLLFVWFIASTILDHLINVVLTFIISEILEQSYNWNCSFLLGSCIVSSVVEHSLLITKIIEKKAGLNFALSTQTLILSLRQTFALACVKQPTTTLLFIIHQLFDSRVATIQIFVQESLTYMTTTLLFIIHQLFDSRVGTIQIFVQESLTQMNRLWLELFIFHSIFNFITITNFCFEASKIVEYKHTKKQSFVIQS